MPPTPPPPKSHTYTHTHKHSFLMKCHLNRDRSSLRDLICALLPSVYSHSVVTIKCVILQGWGYSEQFAPQAFTKSLEHALKQSSVTNQYPIVFQSNSTQCVIVLQITNNHWSFNCLLDWKTIENWLSLDWKRNRNVIVDWLENNL